MKNLEVPKCGLPFYNFKIYIDFITFFRFEIVKPDFVSFFCIFGLIITRSVNKCSLHCDKDNSES